ncbi:Transmembrane protein 53 [Bienertia sinuspersici]
MFYNMGSLSGIFQRPIFTAAAVAVASISTDFPNKLSNFKSSDSSVTSETLISQPHDDPSSSELSWVSHISVSKLAKFSFVTRIQVPVPNFNYQPIPNLTCGFVGNPVASSSLFVNLYQSAELTKASKPKTYAYHSQSVPSEDLYRWHLPEPSAVDVVGKSNCSSAKSRTVVVLLGWLGAKQKHLNKYAEWYTSRGFHVITFTFPMSEVLSYQVGGKAEQDVELLVNHLADWLEEEHGKNLVFHTFSNTGWLTYGVVLEKFQKQDPSLGGRIKGCIVDSAPVASPDPQVWASGFSAAFLKKQSIATKGLITSCDSAKEGSIVARTVNEPKPAVTETALLVLLEKFFEVVLKLPPVNRRLTDVTGLLSSRQPSCPQLYIYSSSDRVIPASSVESFIEQQRKSGHEVRSCNFISTPHVDHFRNDPKLYTSQLTQFLEDCVLKCCKGCF